jgi:hypothetical protein
MSFSNIQNLVVITKIKDPPTLVCNHVGQLSNTGIDFNGYQKGSNGS